jgi:hypothetical protein
MEEIWKDVKGYEDKYMISSKGRLLNKKTNHISMHQINKNEYVSATLVDGKNKKSTRIHRLVAEAFLSNDKNKLTVNHINGIKNDNRVENLEWATYYENTRHASVNGLMNIINLKGEEARKFRLKDVEIKEIRAKYKTGLFSYSDLASEYKSCKSHIGRIVKLMARTQ